MISTTLIRLANKNCYTRDITIRHLVNKLKKLERRTSRPNANSTDYIQRDRVAAQLEDAQKFLC